MTTENTLDRPFLIPGAIPPGPEDQRRQAVKRATSWVLVGLLHVVLFFSFVIAFTPVGERTRPLIETILLLTPPGTSSRPMEDVNPELPLDAPPRLLSAPITIPKPPILPDVDSPNPSATPGDILGAVGRTLSCGAGSWEHMTQHERSRCGYMQPWIARKMPNGNLVMVPASQMPRLRDPAGDGEFRITGSDAIQRNLQTGPPCPILQNIPCLHPSQGGAGISLPLN